MLFCDTSALAKYYVSERESSIVRARFDTEDQVVFSELARAELMGVFHRRLCERKWTKEEYLAAVRQFSQDDIGGYWTWLPLDSEIIEQTIKIYTTLPEIIYLRTADCLHLVTGMHYGFSKIHTYDIHQSKAAPVLGLVSSHIE